MPNPSRGEIWTVNLNPARGHEQAGLRPALIVSVDPFNHGPADLVVVVPMTTKEKHIPFHVPVEADDTGLTKRGFIKCEDIRSISKERLGRPVGAVSPRVLNSVEERLRILLGL
ncbi:MAG: type II toxin-antitoxin system PemK/MazF family toxin [Candidatus Omnitrophica bacterium]|nr:type II toxin-antitoxin system PemK/MazF family toxin [Candidatus Omnitrophota bacterium]